MQTGRLEQWNDERGFGFIEADDGKRYFIHVSDITRIVNRPRNGDRLRFQPGKRSDGRLIGRSATILGANPLPSREARMRGLPQERRRLDWRLPLAALIAILVVWIGFAENSGTYVVFIYAVMSVVTLLLYGVDKNAAEAGRWRVSEFRLHLCDFCCGIAGGLLGQAIWRHKTRKASFVTSTLIIAALHLAWLLAFAMGSLDLDALLRGTGL